MSYHEATASLEQEQFKIFHFKEFTSAVKAAGGEPVGVLLKCKRVAVHQLDKKGRISENATHSLDDCHAERVRRNFETA